MVLRFVLLIRVEIFKNFLSGFIHIILNIIIIIIIIIIITITIIIITCREGVFDVADGKIVNLLW